MSAAVLDDEMCYFSVSPIALEETIGDAPETYREYLEVRNNLESCSMDSDGIERLKVQIRDNRVEIVNAGEGDPIVEISGPPVDEHGARCQCYAIMRVGLNDPCVFYLLRLFLKRIPGLNDSNIKGMFHVCADKDRGIFGDKIYYFPNFTQTAVFQDVLEVREPIREDPPNQRNLAQIAH